MTVFNQILIQIVRKLDSINILIFPSRKYWLRANKKIDNKWEKIYNELIDKQITKTIFLLCLLSYIVINDSYKLLIRIIGIAYMRD